MQHRIPAAFFRGGTSKGLFLRSRTLAPYPVSVQDDIILAAMGSPDPDGRQIDGLGGGISSLSKVAVVGRAKESKWDVEYRFGQVEVKKKTVDWSTTCGNLVAAVGHYAIDERLISPSTLSHLASQHNNVIPVRILAANTGATMIARVPIERCERTGEIFAATEGNTRISGVPGTAAGVHIEFVEPSGGEGVLPTGNVRDVVRLDDGLEVEVSIIDAGLPAVFVRSSSLPVPPSTFMDSPATIDANKSVMDMLSRIRTAAAHLTPGLQKLYSPSAPKIAVVGPATPYTTTSSSHVESHEMDIFARAVSVGNIHRTFPATVLMAAGAGASIKGTVLEGCLQKGLKQDVHGIKWLRVGHPAGVAEAGARIRNTSRCVLESVVMTRTARRLMDGHVLVPRKTIP
ncbi:uncharacterized protein SPPG_04892 [Spizellomyces punctatus DAOM BR117]|uniref:AcnD-accessory protein PrpF n=1 Tax=Spizellomyces punctatus (strain DAOM BR117) TaxID=645134 RepID=A0A0L0HEG9_SPIPD|nr:uncharacterized protein SPPG_04892 [Spizellomyces punctatus DAOM BR117]KNC99497.1 hypothetical protein SPPG_04892 [Spizellomyces punctatus DAOM BR117]|eukprot:XP_016607537.1 hypothetical protein SPPG_04892 [Spizellomyces punctatus DAOM BR117]